MLVHHWSHPTTPAGLGWDIVQTGKVRLITEKGFSARAALGEAEVIRVIVDDPTGVADYKRLHRWYMVEDETAGDQLVWNGYISDQFIDRGEEGDLVHPTGTGRRWELELTQENTLLGFRVVWDEDGDRPKESPGARLTWLLASNYLSTVVDHGLIDWDRLNAMPDMDPNDYRPGTAGDVLKHISLITGLNHYARYRDASSDIELAFYDPNTSELDTSTFRVSNDEADVDHATTWAPFFTGYRLHRKGDRVAAGIAVQWADGVAYGYRLPTSYEFGFIDHVESDPGTKTLAQAERLRDQLLVRHKEQDERIVGLRVQVPAANLNDIRHGQRMQAKFVHEPGWEDFRWARVVSKAFSRPENDTQALYDVDLELSPMATLEPVYGVLYRVDTNANVDNDGVARQLNWGPVGDTPPSGYPTRPTVGLIEALPDPAPYSGAYPWIGWKVLGTGTVNGIVVASYHGVLEAGDNSRVRTVTLTLELNGTPVTDMSVSRSHTGGLRSYLGVLTLPFADVDVVTDDELTATLTITGAGATPAKVALATGQNGERFEITGGSLA